MGDLITRALEAHTQSLKDRTAQHSKKLEEIRVTLQNDIYMKLSVVPSRTFVKTGTNGDECVIAQVDDGVNTLMFAGQVSVSGYGGFTLLRQCSRCGLYHEPHVNYKIINDIKGLGRLLASSDAYSHTCNDRHVVGVAGVVLKIEEIADIKN